MIIPTVGRKVWYRPSDLDLNSRGSIDAPRMVALDAEPLDATVVAVYGERSVNLVIYDINGNKHVRFSVILKQEGDDVPEGVAYAEWMPYQTQQQAKLQEAIPADAETPKKKA